MNKFLRVFAVLLLLNSCKKDHFEVAKKIVAVNFIIPQDSVILNPSGYAPLSAIIKYSYSEAGKTKLIVFGKNGANSNIEHTFNDEGLMHSLTVIGLYANYNNTVEIVLFNSNNDSIAKSVVHIKTGALPANMPTSITTDTADYSSMQPGINLVSSLSAYNPRIPYMLDDYGDVRWLLDYSSDSALKLLFYDDGISRLRNGNFFFGDERSNKIYEVDLLGNIVNTWGLPGYSFHHEVLEKPDGNFLVCATNPSSKNTSGAITIEDYVIEISRQSGSIVNTWDLKESLNEYRTTLTTDPKDWIHINALYYDSADNTILVSGRVQGVVKLDYNNNIKWILGPHKGWGENGKGEDLSRFLLTPLDAGGNKITDTLVINGYTNHKDFEWNWYQHSVIMIPDGNVMVFDNGSARNYETSSTIHYSRAVEYKIDETDMTVKQVWEYGKERGIETYASIISNVQFLPGTNHVLFCPGYNVENANGHGGKIVEIDYATKQVVFQASISAFNNYGFHRTKRISAYP